MAKQLRYLCTSDYEANRSGMLHLREKENGSASPALYDSLYLENPYGDPLLGLCFDGDRLVGQENYIRQRIGLDGKTFSGPLGIHTLVDSDYRMLYGVFGKLCKLTIEAMETEASVLCAFANEESKRYYLKYFQWEVATKVAVYKKATGFAGLNAESLLALARRGRLYKDVVLEQVEKFDPTVLDPVLEQVLKESRRLYVYKTSAFLNWRFLENNRYAIRGYNIWVDQELCGYCVTYDEGRERKILDLVLLNEEAGLFEKVINTLSYLCAREGIRRLMMYATPGCWYEHALRRRLFFKRWDFDFIIRKMTDEFPDGEWLLQIGDFDVF